MKKMYGFDCDDGFSAKGSDEQELVWVAAMHMLMAHPEEKISMKDVKKMVEKM